MRTLDELAQEVAEALSLDIEDATLIATAAARYHERRGKPMVTGGDVLDDGVYARSLEALTTDGLTQERLRLVRTRANVDAIEEQLSQAITERNAELARAMDSRLRRREIASLLGISEQRIHKILAQHP